MLKSYWGWWNRKLPCLSRGGKWRIRKRKTERDRCKCSLLL